LNLVGALKNGVRNVLYVLDLSRSGPNHLSSIPINQHSLNQPQWIPQVNQHRWLAFAAFFLVPL